MSLEFIGLCLISIGVLLSISFITYSPSDPSLIYGPEKIVIKNFFGIYGSIISDFLLQSFGLVSFLLLITIISWGFNLLIKKELNNILLKIFFIVLYLILMQKKGGHLLPKMGIILLHMNLDGLKNLEQIL